MQNYGTDLSGKFGVGTAENDVILTKAATTNEIKS
jgi:hypothetical protein